MGDSAGVPIRHYYLEILEFPADNVPGRGINSGGANKFTFQFQPTNDAVSSTFQARPSSTSAGFSMSLRSIKLGRTLTGFEVTFNDDPLVVRYARNITENIVYDIFAPPVYVEEFGTVRC